MASASAAIATDKSPAGAAAAVTEESKAMWWLRFNNGVPGDDANSAGGEDEGEGAGGKVEMVMSDGKVARDEEEAEMEPGGARAGAGAVKAQLAARGTSGGKTEAGFGGKRRSSPRLADRSIDEAGDYLQPGELPRRKRKAIAKRTKPTVDGAEVQNEIGQGQCLRPVFKRSEQVYEENENLRLQLAQKTTELKQEENRMLQLELVLKTKEMESLQKQNEELKKNVKPPSPKVMQVL